MIDTDLPGSFSALRTTSTWLRDLSTAMEDAGDDAVSARSSAGSDWEGASHEAYRGHVNAMISAGDDRAAVVARCSTAVDTYAHELKSCQEEMEAHRARARNGGLTVSGTQILPPPTAVHPGNPPVDATPAEQDEWDRRDATYRRLLREQQLYDELVIDVRETFDRVDTSVDTVLRPAQEEAAESSGLKDLLRGAKTAADRLGDAVSFGDTAFAARERDLRAAASSAAERLARSRSGNPAVRSGSRAPSARGLQNASRPGTRAGNLLSHADDAARWGRFLKWGGPIVGLIGSGFALAQGDSFGSVAAGYAGGIVGGIAAGAAVAGIAALAGVTAPVWVTGAAIVAGGIAVGAGATYAWNNWVPEGVQDTIDDGAEAVWDWTKDRGSDIGDAVSGAWNSVFG